MQANQRARSEAEAQRAAAAAASAALLKAAPPAAPTTSATSVSRSALESAGDDYKATPSSSFGHGVNSNNEHLDDNEDEEASEGDWDLEYKTGLARHHEDAERQMLEGEEGRRGFASTDDEDEYEDEDDSRHEAYMNDPNTDSTTTGPCETTRTEAGPVTPELSSNDVRNPFDDEQVANVVVPPGATEGPSPIAEDGALDPGDIRAALSSTSGGNDMTGNDLNQFDPLHVAQEGSTTQTTLPPSQPPQLPHPGVKSPDESVMSQGPLWEEAGRVAAAATAESHQQYHQLHPQQEETTNRAAIGQTIRDEYWSRAAVDAGEVAPDTLFRAGAAPHPNAPHPNEMERVATKRVNVVQLLINGLIGLVGGLFGSIYVQACCHFVTVDVGLPLHFGLWQYSPMDSAFQGFTYCYRYDSDYTHDSPTFARLAGLTALLAGTFSMSVLWVYLLFGRTSSDLWMWAVRFLVMATSLQALTFSFFANDVCRRNSCSIGPGSIVSLVSTLSWALVAYEMKDNSPVVSALIPDPHMTMNQQQQGENSGNSGVELTGGYRPPTGSSVGLGVAV